MTLHKAPFGFRPTVNSQIAERFAAILRNWLTPEEFEEMRQLNRQEPDPGICHSHDYCDSNMAMDQAFREYGIDPLPEDGNGMTTEMSNRWNEVWDMAFRRYLS